MSKPSDTNCPIGFSEVPAPRAVSILPGIVKSEEIQVVIAVGFHLFPFRTEKLSSLSPMVLNFGRVGSRRFQDPISFEVGSFFVCEPRNPASRDPAPKSGLRDPASHNPTPQSDTTIRPAVAFWNRLPSTASKLVRWTRPWNPPVLACTGHYEFRIMNSEFICNYLA